MKKVTCFIVVVMLILGITVSGFTFNGYSIDDLFCKYLDGIGYILKAGTYVGGIDFPVGEYILVVDNRHGSDDVHFEYSCEEIPDQSVTKTLAPCQRHTKYFSMFESDTLIIDCPAYLYINPCE